ncbi:MAG: PAC2 family protein [Chloroflexi bacterium]|nr:PAC2 family protein [Chloroflexota bacterium]
MRVGEFEIQEPLPELRSPHIIASLTPWIDAGSVGSLSIERLERYMRARDLGSLAKPGHFFDFTRYRPVVYFEDGKRKMRVPNADLRWATGLGSHDFIFLHMLEPHSNAEEYIEALVEVITYLNVDRFCRIGAMYDAVPHTRPLLVMGTLNGEPLQGVEGVEGNRRRPYQGPTSIMNMVGDRISASGVDNMMLMCRLPHYVELEADFAGRSKMLQVLSTLYGFPAEYAASQRDTQQYARVTSEMQRNAQVKSLVERLESDYDARRGRRQQERQSEEKKELPPLPPSVEEFLGKLTGPGEEEKE